MVCNTNGYVLEDDASAKAHVAVVEHGALPGGDGPLRRGEVQGEAPAVFCGKLAGGVALAVARFGAVSAGRWGAAGDPGGVGKVQRR